MNPIAPWIGVVLLVVCILAQWGFARSHVDPGNLITTAAGVAVAIILGQNVVTLRRRLERKQLEVTLLRDSGRPGAVPPADDTIPPEDPRR